MGRNGTFYDDPCADFFTRLHPAPASTAPSTNYKPWANTKPSSKPDHSATTGNFRVRPF